MYILALAWYLFIALGFPKACFSSDRFTLCETWSDWIRDVKSKCSTKCGWLIISFTVSHVYQGFKVRLWTGKWTVLAWNWQRRGDNIIDSFQGMDSMKGSQIAKCYLSLKVYVGGVIGICVSFIEIAFPAEALSLFGVCMFFVHLEVLSSFSLTRDAFEVFLHLLRSPNLSLRWLLMVAAVRHSSGGDRSYITCLFCSM